MVSPIGSAVICTGMNMPAALALADADVGLDRGRLTICLKDIEAGRLEGQAKLAESEGA